MKFPHLSMTIVAVLLIGYVLGHYFPQLGNRFLP